MLAKHIFAGLIYDENNNPVETVYVGQEPFYVVNDNGFRRHISAEQIDRQIFDSMIDQIAGHEDQVSEQAAKMLGQEDPFSIAMIATQLKNIGQQFQILQMQGIPEEARAYLGMIGFKVIINVHGEVLSINQPGIIDSDDE
ncbi:MAG: hypothetical protein ACPL4H_00955 [Anaerolineales bacterium]